MRAFKKFGRKRGFTLVELMIVVAIIGVLAALAIYGVNRYLSSSKTSEAKNGVGAITRGAVAAFERESAASELLPEGSTSLAANHELCGSAVPVPAAVPVGRKYQPDSTDGVDYQTGDATTGWRCLKFKMSEPSYYQYQYLENANVVTANTIACAGDCFAAAAQGDLDGDGILAGFERVGQVNTTTGALRTASQLFVENELE